MKQGELMVIDINHMPSHCGTWPGLWLNGDGQWPHGGEIDLLEGIGGENYVTKQWQLSVHTGSECIAGNTEQQWLQHNKVTSNNCDFFPNKVFRGCAQLSSDDSSWGKNFNEKG